MTIYNLGSINLDYVYRLGHLVTPGETLSALDMTVGLGGKGANQSLALARAGAEIVHIGALGKADESWLTILEQDGVDCQHVAVLDGPSGHAIVMVDDETAENQIILMAAANHEITSDQIDTALAKAGTGDWALAQNETTLVPAFFQKAKEKGLSIAYSAAPFVAEQTLRLLELTDLLVVNEGEAEALCAAAGQSAAGLGLPHLVITKGSAGADYIGLAGQFSLAAPKVDAVDTTGAGDTFFGYLLAGINANMEIEQAVARAIEASALQVTRPGAAAAIPYQSELSKR
ncbi:MAG: ribokinase [Candidatus Puniceispirillaceae bacterium]